MTIALFLVVRSPESQKPGFLIKSLEKIKVMAETRFLFGAIAIRLIIVLLSIIRLFLLVRRGFRWR